MTNRLLSFLLTLMILAVATQAAPGSLRGVVKTNQGQVISGALVMVVHGSQVRRVVADSDGSFTVDNLAPGEYEVEVRAVGCLPRTLTLTLPAERPVELEMEVDDSESQKAEPGVALNKSITSRFGFSFGKQQYNFFGLRATLPTLRFNWSQSTTTNLRTPGGSLFVVSNQWTQTQTTSRR